MRAVLITMFLLLASACGDDDGAAPDAGSTPVDGGGGLDAGPDAAADASADDASTEDDASVEDAGADAGAPDAGPMRRRLLVQYCPSSGTTAPGAYEGTLATNTNDVTGSCGGASAPGRDGAVRIELPGRATLTATFRHAGDGILSLVDSCPALPTCLASGTSSAAGRTLTWTNPADTTNPVHLILDSGALTGPQSFELDLEITGP